MTLHTIDQTQRKAARVAGVTFLLAIAIVVAANYGISFRLAVPGNAVDTARNIMANETLFRLNIAADLIYVMNVLVMLSALYVVLKPVNRYLALVAALCRMVYALMWGVTAFNMLGALRILGDAPYLPVFATAQLQTLARLHIAIDAYYIGLPFWGVASTVCCYLWFTSRFIPRPLAAFGVLASAWCVFCAFAFIVFPNFDKVVHAGWFDMPLVIFEVWLGFWLLFKGLPSSGPSVADTFRDRPV